MIMTMTPGKEVFGRIQQLQQGIQENRWDGVLVVENIDLYYFSGTAQSAHLYVPAEGEPVLMVRKSIPRAGAESPLSRQHPLTSLRAIPTILAEAGLPAPRVIGLELEILPVRDFMRYQQAFPGIDWQDASELIKRVRSVKSGWELEMVRRSARMHDAMFEYIPEVLRAGMPEGELAGLIEAFARARGHQGYVNFRGFNQEMYYGHILVGANGAQPGSGDSPTAGLGLSPAFPQSVSNHLIQPGEPVIVDYVARYESYLNDQTRVFCIGSLAKELLRAHNVAVEIQNRLADMGKPGVTGGELFSAAFRAAEEEGLADHFQGYGQQAPFVGHGIGLEVNEWPVIAQGVTAPLEEGMVVALEPKFVFPGRGVVGIENTFIVGASGMERLSRVPDEPVVLKEN